MEKVVNKVVSRHLDFLIKQKEDLTQSLDALFDDIASMPSEQQMEAFKMLDNISWFYQPDEKTN